MMTPFSLPVARFRNIATVCIDGLFGKLLKRHVPHLGGRTFEVLPDYPRAGRRQGVCQRTDLANRSAGRGLARE